MATLLQIDGGMLEGVAVNGILEADGSLAAHDTVHVLGERLGDWLTKAGINLLVVPPTQKVGFPVDQAPEAQLAVLQASNVAEALEAVCRHRHMSLSELLKQNVGQTKEAGEEEAKDATESGPPEQPESGGNGDESGRRSAYGSILRQYLVPAAFEHMWVPRSTRSLIQVVLCLISSVRRQAAVPGRAARSAEAGGHLQADCWASGVHGGDLDSKDI